MGNFRLTHSLTSRCSTFCTGEETSSEQDVCMRMSFRYYTVHTCTYKHHYRNLPVVYATIPSSPSLRHHPPSMPAPEIPFSTFCKSESHSDTNTSHQSYAQHRRAPFIVITHRLSLFNSVDTPEEYDHRVEQGNDRGDSERDCGRQGDVVAEIEKGCSDGAEDDGKFEL